MSQHDRAGLDERGLAAARLVHRRVAGAARRGAGRQHVARELGALAGQRRRQDLVRRWPRRLPSRRAAARSRRTTVTAPSSSSRSSWREAQVEAGGDARGDLQRRARLAALDLREHRRADAGALREVAQREAHRLPQRTDARADRGDVPVAHYGRTLSRTQALGSSRCCVPMSSCSVRAARSWRRMDGRRPGRHRGRDGDRLRAHRAAARHLGRLDGRRRPARGRRAAAARRSRRRGAARRRGPEDAGNGGAARRRHPRSAERSPSGAGRAARPARRWPPRSRGGPAVRAAALARIPRRTRRWTICAARIARPWAALRRAPARLLRRPRAAAGASSSARPAHRRRGRRGGRPPAASPGPFAPVRIGERDYVDGGVWSATNLDAAPAAARHARALPRRPVGPRRRARAG